VLIDTAPLDGTPSTDEQLRAQADIERTRPVRPPVKRTLVPPFTLLPRQFQDAHLWATDKWYAYAAAVDPYVALKYEADLYALARAGKSETLPVWLVTRARTATSKEAWVQRQARMASLWKNSHLMRAAGSGHDVQIERPAVVVEAVRQAYLNRPGPNRR
jgi:pimeloyl-ACP methyl ester carboxylesterase